MKGGGVVVGPPDTPNSVEQSPRGSKRGAKSGAAQRRKKQAKPGPGGIAPSGHTMAPGPAGMHSQVQVIRFIVFGFCLRIVWFGIILRGTSRSLSFPHLSGVNIISIICVLLCLFSVNVIVNLIFYVYFSFVILV